MSLLVHSVSHLSILSTGAGKHMLWVNLLLIAVDTRPEALDGNLHVVFPLCPDFVL